MNTLFAAAIALPLIVAFASRYMERAATNRAADVARRARVGETVRSNVQLILAPAYEHMREAALPALEAADKHRNASKRWQAKRAALMSAMSQSGKLSVRHLLVYLVLAIAWVVLFALVMSSDIYLLRSVGMSLAVAQVLGVALAVVFSVMGIVLAGLMGFHPLLPEHVTMPAWVRNTAVAAALSVLILLAFGILSVAPFRAAAVAGSLAIARSVLVQLQASGGTTAQIAAAQSQVDALTAQLSAGETISQVIAVALIVGEVVTSFAPLALTEVGVAGAAGGMAWWHTNRADAADRHVRAVQQQGRTRAVEEVAAYGGDPSDVFAYEANQAAMTASATIVEGEVVDDPGVTPPPAGLSPGPAGRAEPTTSTAESVVDPTPPHTASPPPPPPAPPAPPTPPAPPAPGDEIDFRNF